MFKVQALKFPNCFWSAVKYQVCDHVTTSTHSLLYKHLKCRQWTYQAPTRAVFRGAPPWWLLLREASAKRKDFVRVAVKCAKAQGQSSSTKQSWWERRTCLEPCTALISPLCWIKQEPTLPCAPFAFLLLNLSFVWALARYFMVCKPSLESYRLAPLANN